MTMVSRRQFLRGRLHPVATPLRPPHALAESRFVERCDRCLACLSACPTGVIVRGDGGYPEIDFFRGACDACGACVATCRPGALSARVVPRPARAEVSVACLAGRQVVCRSCGEECPRAAIRFPPRPGGVAQPVIDAARCDGCGACVATCPTRALAVVIADPQKEVA